MVIIRICVGSSCHLKGSEELAEMFSERIAAEGLMDTVVLTGAFCFGKCNRNGVTVAVNDDVYPGITTANFMQFWTETVLPAVKCNL